MSSYEFLTVDVFTEQRFGGNPLAVFPQASGLSDRLMQDLAREFNLSESTFVFPPKDPAHAAQVRIFTPARELPFAGHPNVGTAFVLARLNPQWPNTLVFEEGAGLVAIELLRDAQKRASGARITAPQPLSIGEVIPPEVVAGCVGISAAEVRSATHPPLFAGVGMSFVIAELASAEALAKASPDLGAFRSAAARFPRIGERFQIHLYVRDQTRPDRLATRMFAPILGVIEDPATGSANAALAALLTQLEAESDQGRTFEISQGIKMGRPSRLLATAQKSADGQVRASVAGSCVPVLAGRIEL